MKKEIADHVQLLNIISIIYPAVALTIISINKLQLKQKR